MKFVFKGPNNQPILDQIWANDALIYWYIYVTWQSIQKYGGQCYIYRKTSNIRCTLVGYKIVDHSDVVWAWPVGAAPTTSSFST